MGKCIYGVLGCPRPGTNLGRVDPDLLLSDGIHEGTVMCWSAQCCVSGCWATHFPTPVSISSSMYRSLSMAVGSGSNADSTVVAVSLG